MSLDKKTKKELIQMIKDGHAELDDLTNRMESNKEELKIKIENLEMANKQLEDYKNKLEEARTDAKNYNSWYEEELKNVQEQKTNVAALQHKLETVERHSEEQDRAYRTKFNINKSIIIALVVIYLITICIMCG